VATEKRELLPSDEGTIKEIVHHLENLEELFKIPVMVPITEDSLPADINLCQLLRPQQIPIQTTDGRNFLSLEIAPQYDGRILLRLVWCGAILWSKYLVQGNFKFGFPT
jgi:hypothetical protein